MGVDNLSPAYDDAATIYTSLASTLDGAITTLSGSSDMGDFAGSDLIYAGSTSHWTMLANSLKLRMAMAILNFNELANIVQCEVLPAYIKSDPAKSPISELPESVVIAPSKVEAREV